MARIDTLTAYKCEFSYMRRNNPLMYEQREAIKAGKPPEYTFDKFIEDYTEYSGKLAIGENSDRAILLARGNVFCEEIKPGTTRWHLRPRSGKQGKPVTVLKIPTRKQYNFGSDSAALYDHHVFVYQNSDSLLAVFHRQNGSGCKSVFLETANDVLRDKGLKLKMDLYVPISEAVLQAVPTKITLQYVRSKVSSDVADNYRGVKKRQRVIRDLGLNLEVEDNNKIFKILRNLQMGEINQADAFAQIKKECGDSEEFNDAEVRLRIGNRYRTVKWDDLERIMGSYDISARLRKACKSPADFIPELKKLSDEYYGLIVKSEEKTNAG